METRVLRALPRSSGESTTMLRFPWRPGDCKLTFGPRNSLQRRGAIARLLLLLLMRGAKRPNRPLIQKPPGCPF